MKGISIFLISLLWIYFIHRHSVLFILALLLYLFLYVLTRLFFTFKEISCRQYVSGSYFYFQDKLNTANSDLSLLRSFILTVVNEVIETKSTILLFSIYLICSLFPFYFSFPSFGLFFMILFYLCYCLIKYYFLFSFVLVVAPWFKFPHSSVGKESACNAGDPTLIPKLGRSTREVIGYPLQYYLASLWLTW